MSSTTAIESSSGRLPSSSVAASMAPARAWWVPGGCAYEDLGRRRVAEEGGRAGGQPVGTGLEDDDEVADLGRRQSDGIGQQGQRRAKHADHGGRVAAGAPLGG